MKMIHSYYSIQHENSRFWDSDENFLGIKLEPERTEPDIIRNKFLVI